MYKEQKNARNAAKNALCRNVHQPNQGDCPLAVDFTWSQSPETLFNIWTEFECDFIIAAERTRMLADTLGVPVLPIIFAELACRHGRLPSELMVALGRREPSCDQSADRRALTSELTKLTPPNPAAAMRNRVEVALYFEQRGHSEIARRLTSGSEACSDTTTVSALVWQALNITPAQKVVEPDEERLAKAAECRLRKEVKDNDEASKLKKQADHLRSENQRLARYQAQRHEEIFPELKGADSVSKLKAEVAQLKSENERLALYKAHQHEGTSPARFTRPPTYNPRSR